MHPPRTSTSLTARSSHQEEQDTLRLLGYRSFTRSRAKRDVQREPRLPAQGRMTAQGLEPLPRQQDALLESPGPAVPRRRFAAMARTPM